jgi:hypothetical protein
MSRFKILKSVYDLLELNEYNTYKEIF